VLGHEILKLMQDSVCIAIPNLYPAMPT